MQAKKSRQGSQAMPSNKSFFQSMYFPKVVRQSSILLVLNLGLFVGLPILNESKFGSNSAKEGLIIGLIIAGIMSTAILILNYVDYTKGD